MVLSAPLAPRNVTWTETDDGVEVTWDAPLYDGGAEVLTYNVYRDDVLIAEGLTDEVYLDTDVLGTGTSANPSMYVVTAVNEAGESPPNSSGASGVCLITQPAPGVDPSGCAGAAVDLALWVIDQVT